MNEDNKMIEEVEESSIDFGKIFKDLLKHKTLYYKVLPIAFVLAAIYALSLPNYYNCTVKLAPELGSGAKTGGSLAGLASSFGINLGSTQAGADAINPTLYPDLMESVDFKTSLFPVKVKREDDGKVFTYYEYLMNEQKAPWWSEAKAAIFGLFSSKEEETDNKIDPFQLTKEQTDIVKAINKNVVCDVDKKTFVITINVTDQDPLICATLADSVKTRLQDFLTAYRTQKARHDLAYAESLQRQAKKDYEHARQLYVDFMDSNKDLVMTSAQQKQIDLENDMQLQYNNYNALNAQVIAAKAKVQEVTPAFTPLQSATVPLGPAGPKRGQIIVICLLVATLFVTIWALHKEDQLKPLLGLS